MIYYTRRVDDSYFALDDRTGFEFRYTYDNFIKAVDTGKVVVDWCGSSFFPHIRETGENARIKLLYGVDANVYNGTLYTLKIVDDDSSDLKLSSFCKVIKSGSVVSYWNRDFVFDSGIERVGEKFVYSRSACFYIVINEGTRDSVLRRLYLDYPYSIVGNYSVKMHEYYMFEAHMFGSKVGKNECVLDFDTFLARNKANFMELLTGEIYYNGGILSLYERSTDISMKTHLSNFDAYAPILRYIDYGGDDKDIVEAYEDFKERFYTGYRNRFKNYLIS